MNESLRLLHAHRSVRRYRPSAVPECAIRAAVEAAQRSSTSHWVQAYALIQVERAETRAHLAELAGEQAQVREAGAFFVLCADARRHRLLAEDQGLPHVENLESFLVGTIDAALFAQSLILAFESQGYGVCCIGGLRTRIEEVDRLLELPRQVYPLFGLCVGEPAEAPPPKPRLRPEAVWMRERYAGDERIREDVRELDRRAAAYYAALGKPGRSWSGGTARQHQRAMREHLHAYYTGKGARLT